MKIKKAVATPSMTGLVYKHAGKQVGVVVDGIVFYPDGSSELGMKKVLALGTALDFMLRIIASAERHAVAKGTLIPVEQYAATHNLPLDELKAWADTSLGYVCGCRRVKIGILSVLYVPATLQAEMVAAQEWLDSNHELEEKIVVALVETDIYTMPERIARMVDVNLADATRQLDRMCLKKMVSCRGGRYRISAKYLRNRNGDKEE